MLQEAGHRHNAANAPNVSVAANSTASGKVPRTDTKTSFVYFIWLYKLKAPIDFFEHYIQQEF